MTLGSVEEERMMPFLTDGTPERAVLSEWVRRYGGGTVRSEAAVLRALLLAGAAAMRDEVLDLGYSELAVLYDEEESANDRRAARDRYIERTEASAP